jgi:glycosyltransferase involved in cell wall biosynthesis
MKVLLVNTYDKGGAANACIRLHHGLNNVGVASNLIVKHKTKSNIPDVFSFKPKSAILNFVYKIKFKIETFKNIYPNLNNRKNIFLKKRPKGLEMYSFPNSICDITKSKFYQDADIIHLHWVADFLDWESFFKINTKPVVWTLHDQNPFLAGEHYAERFFGIDESGRPIPRQYTDDEIKMDNIVLSLKKQYLHKIKNLHIVTPSKWLLNSSQNSELFGAYSHHHIPYGFSDINFKPHEKTIARHKFGIPEEKIVLLFVSEVVKHNRKGYTFLNKAMKELKELDNLLLCTVGSGNFSDDNKDNVMHLGEIKNEADMAKAYSAADGYIITSIEDNFPNTVVESLMCGCPVIAFPTGGIVDAVEHSLNGLISEDISVNSLVELIKKFINQFNSFNRQEISKIASEKYSNSKQSEKYLKLYNQILKI